MKPVTWQGQLTQAQDTAPRVRPPSPAGDSVPSPRLIQTFSAQDEIVCTSSPRVSAGWLEVAPMLEGLGAGATRPCNLGVVSVSGSRSWSEDPWLARAGAGLEPRPTLLPPSSLLSPLPEAHLPVLQGARGTRGRPSGSPSVVQSSQHRSSSSEHDGALSPCALRARQAFHRQSHCDPGDVNISWIYVIIIVASV